MGLNSQHCCVELLFIMTDGDSGQSIGFQEDAHATKTQVTAMHVPPPCSGTGHTGILCSQEAPGPGSGQSSATTALCSSRLECFVSCRVQVYGYTSVYRVSASSATGWAPGSGTRFPESPDETLESSIDLSLLGSHPGNDHGTQKNRRERPLVPSVVAGFR